MIVKSVNDDNKSLSLHIGTGTRINTGKEYIYCELSYHDKKAKKHYSKVFPSSKYDTAVNSFYLLSDERIKPHEVF